jgi:ABC-2 type transport system ATP-binding protein
VIAPRGLTESRVVIPVDPIVIRGARKTYVTRRRIVEAVVDVSLRVQAGEVLGLLGPNGSGKTTTIKMIAGLIAPDAGTIRVHARDPHRDRSVLARIGAILEGGRNLYWRLSPEENLEYFGVLKGLTRRDARSRGQALLQRFDLADRRAMPVQQLSRGMQQKVALAVALIHRPTVLLCDEPTIGLDVESAAGMLAMIRELVSEGHAVLLTTHQLDVAERIADRVAIIDKGRIVVEGHVSTLLRRFSASGTYRIVLAQHLDTACRLRAQRPGVRFENDDVIYTGDVEGLYDLLARLRPAPLMRVLRDGADLTSVFLHVIQEQRRA